MKLKYCFALVISLFSMGILYSMNSLKKNKINLFKNFLQKNIKRNIIVGVSGLQSKQNGKKVLFLSDMHEPEKTSITQDHTKQVMEIIALTQKKPNNSFIMEFSDFNKKYIQSVSPIVIDNIRTHVHKNTIPYVNFDTRNSIDVLMSLLLLHHRHYIEILRNNVYVPEELCYSVETYLNQVKAKKRKTILEIDNLPIQQSVKNNLIKYGYELSEQITSFIEQVLAHHALPMNTFMMSFINFIAHYYNKFPQQFLMAEGSFHADINLLKQIIQNKSPLSVVFGGGMHCAAVEKHLKTLEFTPILEEHNGLKIDLENYTVEFPKTVSRVFLTDAVYKFIS